MATHAPAEILTPDPSGSLLPNEREVGLTVEEYNVLLEAGAFGRDRRVFLWQGRVCEKLMKTPDQAFVSYRALQALMAATPEGWLACVGLPIRIDPATLWEPELGVARGPIRMYEREDRFPNPGDVALVFELTSSTLPVDLEPRALVYARAGIPAYWAVDAAARRIVEHRGPGPDGYATVRVPDRDDPLTIPLDGVEVGPVRAGDLLP